MKKMPTFVSRAKAAEARFGLPNHKNILGIGVFYSDPQEVTFGSNF
jgi:hypothetical protein